MLQDFTKSKNRGPAIRRLALGFTITLAIFLQGPIAFAQQSPEPSAVSQNQPAPAAGVAREPNASANTIAKSVTVGLRELSPWSMFVSASLIVQAIMIGLAFASLVTWTIFVAKFIELFIAKRKLAAAVSAVAGARTLSEASSKLAADRSIMRPFVAAAIEEIGLSPGLDSDIGIKERVASSFSELIKSEARRVRFGMGVLATIGATAPFVGLFGTVWGIMN